METRLYVFQISTVFKCLSFVLPLYNEIRALYLDYKVRKIVYFLAKASVLFANQVDTENPEKNPPTYYLRRVTLRYFKLKALILNQSDITYSPCAHSCVTSRLNFGGNDFLMFQIQRYVILIFKQFQLGQFASNTI